MSVTKTLIKKTKRGGILKIVREHYLRDNVPCGLEICIPCNAVLETFNQTCSLLTCSSASFSSPLFSSHHIIIPDTNVVLNQIDILEHELIQNVLVLQTIQSEVRHCSTLCYKRLKDCLGDSDKHFFTFMNEFHKETYVERTRDETLDQRNQRAIGRAAIWFKNHIKNTQLNLTKNKNKNEKKEEGDEDNRMEWEDESKKKNFKGFDVILLTEDAESYTEVKSEGGIFVLTVKELLESIDGCDDLKDRLGFLQDQMISSNSNSPLFPEHLPLSELQKRLKLRSLVQGTFRANRENYLEAYVSVHDSDKEIFIQGRLNLNRAVNDDVVAVEMLPEDEWSCPSSLVVDADEEEDEEEENDEKEMKKVTKTDKRVPSGKVVGIIKRNWRQYCGILQQALVKGTSRHLFVPAEKKIPKIRIETRQSEKLANQRIVVVIDGWPRYSRYPQGHLVRRIGEIGEKDTENEVLLLEHEVPHNVFSQGVLQCLPSLPWVITDKDLSTRKDLRDTVICSVDPPGCTDIDDALHCKQLSPGLYEVGVHIADVSHFIRPSTALDKEAALRGTTVYLIDKRIDMVPELLSSNLCSLREKEERFAFSVIWEMNDQAEVLKTIYTKSLIKSQAAMTYAEAQMKIDDISQKDEVSSSLRRLNQLAKILKKKRLINGALSLASPEIRFHIDSETHDPVDVQSKELRETNSMVEEFMLLANTSTASRILQEFPNCSVLRRHPQPPASNFEVLIKVAKNKGFDIDASSGKTLAESLEKAIIPDNPYFNTMLRILATRCMMQAVYFSSGTMSEKDFFHYGLAAPIYTHFTSPIRRYSDILVHRLLAVCIGADEAYPDLLDKMKIQEICNNLNFRHRMAQYAGRASVALYTQIFFKNQVLDEEGYILYIKKNALQVLIPKYGLEGTIFLDRNHKILGTFDEESNSFSFSNLTLWPFQKVIVQISINTSSIQHQKLVLHLVYPQIEGLSVEAKLNTKQDDTSATTSSIFKKTPKSKNEKLSNENVSKKKRKKK